MRILLVTAYPPHPPLYGGSVRVAAMLSRLARRHEVHLLTFIEGDPEPGQRAELASMCASVGFVRQPIPATADRRWYYLAETFASATPPYVSVFDSAQMRLRMLERIDAGVDVVQLEWAQMAQYCLPEAAGRTAITEHDIFFESLARYASADEGPLKRAVRARRAVQMRRWELDALGRVGGIFAVSDDDRDTLSALLPGARVATVPSGADLEHYSLDPHAPVLVAPRCPRFLFVGGLAHEPNLDGLMWFVEQVMPLVKVQLPDARLDVLGGDVHGRAAHIADPSVRLHGFVADTRPYLADAITVVPIRLGAGVRIKALEAMAAGSPMVATTHGISGLGARPGEHLLLAEDACSFADALVALARDAPLRARLARSARAFAEERYGWDTIVETQEALYEEWFSAR